MAQDSGEDGRQASNDAAATWEASVLVSRLLHELRSADPAVVRPAKVAGARALAAINERLASQPPRES